MRKILVIVGSGIKNGNTDKLADAMAKREKGILMAPFVTYIIKKSKTTGRKISARHHDYTKFQGKVNVY